jgi:hypothetical protein
MLQNRIVRALVGVVFAKAAVAAGWYLYQKSKHEENNWSKDDQKIDKTPVTHDLSAALKEVEAHKAAKKVAPVNFTPVMKNTVEAVKPKRVRTAAPKKAVTTKVDSEVAPVKKARASRAKVAKDLAPKAEKAPAKTAPKAAAKKVVPKTAKKAPVKKATA